MPFRMELISLAIAAVGGIVAAYATVYEPISRNVSLWLNYVGAAIVLFAPWFYVQQKYWEEDAAPKTERRAWLAASADVTGPLTPGKNLPWKVSLRNTGDSPVSVVNFDFRIALNRPTLDEMIASVERLAKENRQQTTVPPGGEIVAPWPIEFTFDESWIAQIESGQQNVFLLGFFRYRDASGEHYTTRFCYQYDADRKRLTQIAEPGYNTME
jgi:hypothetical protein